jgi:phage baseplate assembly protein W
MSGILKLGVPLGGRRPVLHGADAILARLRMVLETRPGRLPWRPEFGCDLEVLVGEPASPQNLSRANFLVQRAITRWIPEVQVVSCQCEARALPESMPGSGLAPAGEGALLSLGSQAVLSVHLVIQSSAGPLQVDATITP